MAVGVGVHVVPGDLERDLVAVVDRPHLDGDDRWVEVASRLHDLADHREEARRGVGEGLLRLGHVLRLVEGREVGHRHGAHQVGVRILDPLAGLGQDPTDDLPALLDREAVGEAGHGSAGQAGRDRAEDVLGPVAAAEGPGHGQVGRTDRVAPVVAQGEGRRAVAPALLAVAAGAADLDEGLVAHLLGVRAELRCLGDVDGRGIGLRVLEIGREGLEVLDDVGHLPVGEDGVEVRHAGVGQAVLDRAPQVVVGGEVPGGRRAELVLARGEVAGPRVEARGGDAVAGAVVAVALGAVLGVDLLARLALGVGAQVGLGCVCGECGGPAPPEGGEGGDGDQGPDPCDPVRSPHLTPLPSRCGRAAAAR